MISLETLTTSEALLDPLLDARRVELALLDDLTDAQMLGARGHFLEPPIWESPQGMTLGCLASRLVGIPAEPPQCRETAGDLDRGVETEADEGDAPGEKPRDQRGDAFERVPGDGDVL